MLKDKIKGQRTKRDIEKSKYLPWEKLDLSKLDIPNNIFFVKSNLEVSKNILLELSNLEKSDRNFEWKFFVKDIDKNLKVCYTEIKKIREGVTT